MHWKAELDKTADKYHHIGAWVAIVFNLFFSLNDYLMTPEHWLKFFIARSLVSLLTLMAWIAWRRFRFNSAYMIFVPFSLICIENAFMWSFMDVAEFRSHTLAYMAIYIGAGMLIIWRYFLSVLVVILSLAANLFFLKLNSALGFSEIMINGGILTGSVAVFSILLIQTRYNLYRKEIISRLKLAETNILLNEQKAIVEDIHLELTDSIRYAEKIQHAMLPGIDQIRDVLPESFVWYQPKDIVSGDFFWFSRHGDTTVIAAIDCTGHGVPGALMSMLGHSLLNRIIGENKITKPAEILWHLRTGVIESLKKNGSDTAYGGMDMAVCSFHSPSRTLQFSGAFNPLIGVRNGQIIEIKPDRMPVGRYADKEHTPFTPHEIVSEPGDRWFIFSDGFGDQFGGPENKKYGSRRFKEFLRSSERYPMQSFARMLEKEFVQWKRNQEQIDDIIVIGFQID